MSGGRLVPQTNHFEKPLVVWMNSSLGLLTLLAKRNSTHGGWVALKKADLRELSVLDTRRLTRSQLSGLSDLFDELAEAEFDRLPGMADCPARTALDDGVSEILWVAGFAGVEGFCWRRSRWFVIGGCEGYLMMEIMLFWE